MHPENAAAGPAMEIRELDPVHTAAVRETVAESAMPATLGRIFGLVMAALEKQGVASSGPPFTWYHSFGDRIDMEAGFPVEAPIEPEGEVRPGELPTGPALFALHVGPYDALADTYRLMEDRMAELGRAPAGGPFECYLTDPDTTAQAGWRTELYQPLQHASSNDVEEAIVS